MKQYIGEPEFEHGEIPAVGVLLANLGTPDAPTTPALKRYLKQFLSDPRVIELPRWKWQPILRGIVLPRRSPKSAEAYREVWTEAGSPLLVTGRKLLHKIEAAMRKAWASPMHVALGMRYGNPSIRSAVDELQAKGCRRIVLLPLYPQYSATTTASTFDALSEALVDRRWIPELRTIHQYCDEPLYTEALANSIRELWDKDGRPEKLLLSYHGIPLRYYESGDLYPCHCHKTTRLLVEKLGLNEDEYLTTFQSRFGREPWLEPYTDMTLKAWGKAGLKSVDVICPGFSADCLETIEEIDQENREYFEESGGGRYRYIPALNDRDDHVRALMAVLDRNLAGWAERSGDYDADAAQKRAETSRNEAKRLSDSGPRCPYEKDAP